MKKYSRGIFSVLGAAVLGIMAGCVSSCADSAFADRQGACRAFDAPANGLGSLGDFMQV